MRDKQKPDLKEEIVQVTFRCPVAIRNELKRIAQEQDRILGQQVVKCLRDWLARRALMGVGSADTESPMRGQG